jgi:hypothetical protein
MFGTLDNGDDCNGLDPLERRLYHPYAMPEARLERQINAAKAEWKASKGKGKGSVGASASAPLLGTNTASAGTAAGRSSTVTNRQGKTTETNARSEKRDKTAKAPRSEFVPYDTSDVMSVASGWKKHYAAIAPPGLFAMGLLVNDISNAHHNTPGVCTLRPMNLPAVQSVEKSPFQARVDHVNRELASVEARDAKCRAAFARPTSPGGSSQGVPGEMLPRQQHLTSGRPALCRPLPADVTTTDQRGRYSVAQDSLTTSEHRSNFWWKGTTQERMKEIKQFVRPLDDWVHFRDNCSKMKQSGVMRFPINTY